MKKQTKINYILTLILVFCIGASIPVLTGSSQVTEQHSAKSEVPYCGIQKAICLERMASM